MRFRSRLASTVVALFTLLGPVTAAGADVSTGPSKPPAKTRCRGAFGWDTCPMKGRMR